MRPYLRRSMKRTFWMAGILFGCISAWSCGGSGNVNVISGEFFGTTSDNAEDVVVIADPSAGGSTRTFHAYATDGTSVSEFFSGQVNGNLFDLSNGEAELSGTLDSFGVTGNLTLTAGSVGFAATTSGSPAGLYTVTIDPLGLTVSGTGADGTPLTGTLAQGSGDFTATVKISPAGGSASKFTVTLTGDSNGQQHWVVMPDLSVKGGPVPSQGTGFAMTP